jgi:hypothetical protein
VVVHLEHVLRSHGSRVVVCRIVDADLVLDCMHNITDLGRVNWIANPIPVVLAEFPITTIKVLSMPTALTHVKRSEK